VDVSISLSDPKWLDATPSCNKTAMPHRTPERHERQVVHGSRRISGPNAGFIVSSSRLVSLTVCTRACSSMQAGSGKKMSRSCTFRSP